MGRAESRPRERHSRPSTGPARALTPGIRRPAGPASLSRFRLLGLPRLGASAAACLLALAVVMLFGAGAAQAQAPVFSSAEVTWRTLTVTFDRALKPQDPNGSAVGRPDGRAFTATVTAADGTTRTMNGACGITGMGTISGTKVWVTMCGTVYEGETATVSYDKTKASNSPSMRSNGTRLAGTGGAEVANFTNMAVTNASPPITTPSNFIAADVGGSTLTLVYDRALKENSMTPGSAFAVTAGSRTYKGTGRARISGDTVNVSLDGTVPVGVRVNVAYTRPSANPLRTAEGRAFSSFDEITNIFVKNRGDRTPPTLLSAAAFAGPQTPQELLDAGANLVDEGRLLLEFDELLHEPYVPEAKDFRVTVNGERLGVVRDGVWVQGRNVLLFLESGMFAGDLVEVSYTRRGYRPWDHYGPLMDTSGNYVASFSRHAAINRESGPEVASAEADGTRLTVNFSEAIDPCCKGTWRVTAGAGSSEQDISVQDAGTTVAGNVLTLSLGTAVEARQRVRLAYDGGGSAVAVRDLEGNALATFSEFDVTNVTAGPRFASAAVDRKTLTVTFDEALDAGSVPAPGDFHVTVGNARRNVAAGGVAIDGATVTLTLASAAARADRVRVRYTKGTSPLRDPGGSEVASFTDRTVANAQPPSFRGAQVDGRTITLTFDEPLDRASVPEPRDFFVIVGDDSGSDRRLVAPGGVAIDGATVKLTLSWPAAAGETVTLSYKRFRNPLRDRDGNEVENFAYTEQPVTNNTVGEVWSATLTVKSVNPNFGTIGCGGDGPCSSGLTDDSFTYARISYLIDAVFLWDTGGNITLGISTDKAVSQDWTLHVGDRTFPVADATLTGNGTGAQWTNSGLNWSIGDKVSVRLSVGASDEGAPSDATGPAFQSAEANGDTVTLAFDGTLDARSVPAPVDFHISSGGIRRDIAEGGVAIDGATVTLTLKYYTFEPGETGITVRYARGATPLRGADGKEVADFADAEQPVTNNTVGEVWSATLTVKSVNQHFNSIGCGGSGPCSSGLTDDSFTYAGISYGIDSVFVVPSSGGTNLGFSTNKAVSRDWTLHVGDRQFSLADATLSGNDEIATWTNSGLNWSVGDKVELALWVGKPAAAEEGATASSGPGFQNAQVSGRQLRVTFDEPLDEDATPPGDSFTVRTLPDGGGTGKRLAQGQGGTSSGTGATSVEGRTVTVTLDRPVAPGDRVVVSYDRPDENAIRDESGDEAEGFDARPAANVPPVTAVAVVSDAGDDETYALGDTIRVRVTFAEKVNVDTAGGTPRLTIKMDPTWGEFQAQYAGGSGTANLVFTHKVVEPNTSPRGIAVLANTLELNGGTIRSKATGADADLAHAGLGHDAKHKVNWRIQPSDVTAVALVSDAGSDDTYALGDTIRVRVTFAGTVNVDTASGTPRLKIKMDPTWGEFWAAYAGGHGTASLTFTHTVAKPNTSPRGIAVLANTLQANGGAIRLAATNANARLGHTGLGHDPAHKVNWRLSPPVASTPPGAPTGVTVQGASNTGLSVSWTAPTDTGSAAIAGYELRWHAGASDPADASGWTETGDVGAGTSATIADLAADTAYRVQVRARGAGKGPWSSSGAGRTQAAGDTTPPVPESATVNWREVTVTFDEDLVPVGAGASLNFWFTVSGGGTQQHPVRATASGNTVTMELGPGSPARAGRSYTIGYYGNGPLEDAAGNAVVEFSGLAAENLTQPRLSVADAKAHEGTDASMEFAVTLDAAMDEAVTVDYATADGSATAGEDYTATSGTLTFAAGERSKTVSVGVLDDAIDEGKETFRLRLSNAQGAVIEDGEAVGTITNSDPLQKMWLSRFGRTVADHVTGAVSGRLAAPLTGAQVTVGGQTVNLAEIGDEARLGETLTAIARIMGAPSGPGPAANDDGWGSPGSGPGQTGAAPGSGSGAGSWPGTGLGDRGSPALDGTTTRDITGRELLLGSAFHLAREGDGRAPGLAAWGRVTVGGFDGEAPADEGNVRIDGNVTTGILGADAEWGRMLAGVAVSVSEGEGSFAQSGVDSGGIESTMTTVSPYARVTLSDRITAWGLAGYGTGDMTIVQKANEATGQPERVTRTDLSMRLAALGGRGALLTADENGGIDLALKADAFYVETTSEAVSNEGDTSADASRVRLALEGSRAFEVGGGVLTPGLELGLRHDGGDAETGTGVELGGRLSWADPETGLGMDLNVRALVAHEDSKYREWGASGAVRLAPGERGRGLSFSLAPTWGTAGSGVDRLWSARDARGVAPGSGTFEPESRLEGELGYGLPLLGDRFTGTPNVGFGLSGAGARDYRIGWRITSVVRGDPGFQVTLDATRREPANDNGAGTPVEHGVMLRSAIRW